MYMNLDRDVVVGESLYSGMLLMDLIKYEKKFPNMTVIIFAQALRSIAVDIELVCEHLEKKEESILIQKMIDKVEQIYDSIDMENLIDFDDLDDIKGILGYLRYVSGRCKYDEKMVANSPFMQKYGIVQYHSATGIGVFY